MSRWIDADAWWKAVQKHYTDGDCADDDRYELGINVGITKSRNVMMSAPSIDIVRCGECKHRSICCRGNIPLNDNGYCSDGERNTDSNTFNTLDALKKKKADFRQVWLDDEYNEIGRSNSEGADDEVR